MNRKIAMPLTVRVLGLLLIGTTLAPAADISYTEEGSPNILEASGTIQEESPREIVFQTKQGKELRVPFYRVESIKYDNQPQELVSIRNLQRQSRHDEVIDALEKIMKDLDPERDEFLVESLRFELLQARAEKGLADPAAREAALAQYAADTPRLSKSRHHYPSLELIGRLQLQAKEFAQAEEMLGKLGSVEAPGYMEKAQVYQGLVAQARGRNAEAIRFFDEAIASTADSDVALEQKLFARVGKAECLLKEGKGKESSALCREVIDSDAAVDQPLILARAHNALGDALLVLKKPKEAALEGYLWVHVLYEEVPEEHARALYHLSSLLKEIGYPAYSERMTELLKSSFGTTEWGKKLSSAGT